MGERLEPAPEVLDQFDDDLLRRRFRQLDRRLAISVPSSGRRRKGSPTVVAQVQKVSERMRRNAAKVDDPAERLAIAEAAYLAVFDQLPSGP